MITDSIIVVIYGILTVVSSPLLLLDNVTTNSSIVSAITQAGGYIQPLSIVVPLDTLRNIIIIFTLFETWYGIYKIIRWVYRKIPGVT